jgi:hypothetical protein
LQGLESNAFSQSEPWIYRRKSAISNDESKQQLCVIIKIKLFYRPAESENTDIFCHVLMDFHPTFPKENDKNHPKQEPRALNPVFLACLKGLTSIFSLVKRVSYFYRPAESENTDIFYHVLMDFHPTFSKENDQNRPQQEPRALNPIAIPYLKALTSIFWLLNRVSTFYRPAESEETDILKPGFDGFSPHFFQRK